MDMTSTAAGFVAVSSVLLLFFLLYGTRRSYPMDKYKRPLPQPSITLPLLGNVIDLATQNDRFHDWLTDLCNKFGGKPFALSGPGMPTMVVVSTPDHFEDILKTQFHNFGKGELVRQAYEEIFGTSIAVVDGDRWKFQRKVLAKMFTARALKESMSAIISSHAQTLDQIFRDAAVSRQPFDLAKLLNSFTMEVFTEIGFGVKLNNLGSDHTHPFEQAIDDAVAISTIRATTPMWLWKLKRLLNIGSEAHLKRCIQTVDATVTQVISKALDIAAQKQTEATATHSQPKDIMSLFLCASESENTRVVDAALLRGISIGMLMAGRDTSSQALSWFFYCLDKHANVEAKIREELRTKIPDITTKQQAWFPSMDDIDQLTYLEAALTEAMRLHPSVPFQGRECLKDTILSDGTFVPRGTMVFFTSYASMRLTTVWGEDAAKYKPERWIDTVTGKLVKVSPFQYSVFLAGPRMCLGMNFAMHEMMYVAAGLLSRFSVMAVPGQHVTYEKSLTLPMKDPFMVHIRSVNGPAASA